MKANIYVYKMVTDNGGAPCVWRGLLSLAICKPKIRRSAGKHDVVFGFGGKRYNERLIYIAKVTDKESNGRYYRKSEYSRRPDCIYKSVGGRARRKGRARYHNASDQRKRDVGIRFQRADVILSKDFRYFGKNGRNDYKHNYPTIKKLIEALKRGHRVNHSVKLHHELSDLKVATWKRYHRMTLGPPTDSDRTKLCNRETASARC
jgi:hypothetical protein